jgi:epoxide hydrolase-like predicted phosphatase
LNLPEENRDALVSDFWRGDRIDDALVDYIRSLRARVKTALITNAWPGTRQALEQEWGIADAFDLVVISSEVGTTKPGRRIYELALDRLAVRPEEALLVDDSVENITGAESAGMHTVLFRSPEQAMADVRSLLDGIETPRPGAERAVDPS